MPSRGDTQKSRNIPSHGYAPVHVQLPRACQVSEFKIKSPALIGWPQYILFSSLLFFKHMNFFSISALMEHCHPLHAYDFGSLAA